MKKVFVAGHRGMVGSAIERLLLKDPSVQVITASRDQLDLTDQLAVRQFFLAGHFDEVYIAAAKVGGINANNSMPADFIYQNLMIQSNIIDSARLAGVVKLLFLGSSCIYPKNVAQPMSESALLSGHLEPTNEPYAIAKIAGVKLCESYNRQYNADFRSIMPCNLYGPKDNFDPITSHVIPGLIHKFHQAKLNKLPSVEIWGTGKAMREFLFVDDLARAALHVMNMDYQSYWSLVNAQMSHLNVGTGVDLPILDVAREIAEVVGFDGFIETSPDRPEGTPRKLLDSSLVRSSGWSPATEFSEGLRITYQWFLSQQNQ